MSNSPAGQCLRVQDEETAMKVFIADDSAIIRERLVALLSGISNLEIVGHANNTRVAKKLIQELRPEVLILDIQMPGGSGIELLRQLKQETPNLVVMMVTGSSFPQYRKRCLQAGADYFFDKATDFEQIRETLCNLIPQFTSPSKAME